MTIRVLLVDDHRLVREALRDALARESDVEVVGEAGDAATAFEQARALRPDVVVLDIGLPGLNGVEATRGFKAATGVDAKIVALSFHMDRRFVTDMLRAGASAYVTKSSAGSELVRAIRAAVAGQDYVCPEVTDTLVSAVLGGPQKAGRPHLSRRELEVLRLIAEGRRSPDISVELHITSGTVEVHRRNIMRKLGLRNVADLTRYALREGLLGP